MYVGRVFFDSAGKLLYHYQMQGEIVIKPIDDDINFVATTKEIPINEITVIELVEDDLETREKVKLATNITLVNGEMVFDFTPPDPIVIQEPIDAEKVAMAEAIIALEARVNELEAITGA